MGSQVMTPSISEDTFNWRRDVWSGSFSPKKWKSFSGQSCYFACEVWQNILISQSVHIAVDSNEDFEKIMLLFWNSVCFHPSGIVYKVLPWIFWPLWRDRNLLIFENRSLSSDLSRERSLGQATEPEVVCKSHASWDKTLKELDWLGFSQESTLVRLDKDTQPWILQTPHSWQTH